jgi:hypothetical protein
VVSDATKDMLDERHAAAEARSLTRLRPGEQPLPDAYRPVVSLDKNELTDIAKRTEQWASGDLDDATLYTQRRVFAIYQTLGEIALKDVGGRNGLNARIQAARGFFEMATKVLALVAQIRKEHGFVVPKPPEVPVMRRRRVKPVETPPG